MKLPTVLLLNGLFQYQPALLTPLGNTFGLRPMLEQMGFRVVTDNHFQTWHSDEEPVAVLGHSRGGGAALEFAKQQVLTAKYHPLVITFDAVPPYPCPVRTCYNFKSESYFPVPGATNIPVPHPLSHTYMVLIPSVKDRVRTILTPLARPMP